MPSPSLSGIIHDISPYQAEYIPVDSSTRPSQCIIPPVISGDIVLEELIPIQLSSDCSPLIPAPFIFATPYIPPIVGPCPGGFVFGGSLGVTLNGNPVTNSVAFNNNEDNCGATLTGSIPFINIPVWKGEWVLGPFGLYDFVTFSGCGYISTSANNTTTPGAAGANWQVIGCTGGGGGGGSTTVSVRRNPFEISLISSNLVMMHCSSSLMVSFDVSSNLQVPIKGADKPFNVVPGDVVYLEMLFDSTKPNLPLEKVYLAKSQDKWDDVATSVFPQMNKLVTPDTAQAEKVNATAAVNNNYLGLTSDQKAAEISDITTLLTSISNISTYQSFPRHFKSYLLLGHALDKPGGDFNMTYTPDSTPITFGFKQAVTTHIILKSETINGVPSIIPSPFSAGILLQAPPILTTLSGGNTTATLTLDISGTDPNFGLLSLTQMYYTIDGNPANQTDGATPSATALIYTGPFTVASGMTINSIAIKAGCAPSISSPTIVP